LNFPRQIPLRDRLIASRIFGVPFDSDTFQMSQTTENQITCHHKALMLLHEAVKSGSLLIKTS